MIDPSDPTDPAEQIRLLRREVKRLKRACRTQVEVNAHLLKITDGIQQQLTEQRERIDKLVGVMLSHEQDHGASSI